MSSQRDLLSPVSKTRLAKAADPKQSKLKGNLAIKKLNLEGSLVSDKDPEKDNLRRLEPGTPLLAKGGKQNQVTPLTGSELKEAVNTRFGSLEVQFGVIPTTRAQQHKASNNIGSNNTDNPTKSTKNISHKELISATSSVLVLEDPNVPDTEWKLSPLNPTHLPKFKATSSCNSPLVGPSIRPASQLSKDSVANKARSRTVHLSNQEAEGKPPSLSKVRNSVVISNEHSIQEFKISVPPIAQKHIETVLDPSKDHSLQQQQQRAEKRKDYERDISWKI